MCINSSFCLLLNLRGPCPSSCTPMRNSITFTSGISVSKSAAIRACSSAHFLLISAGFMRQIYTPVLTLGASRASSTTRLLRLRDFLNRVLVIFARQRLWLLKKTQKHIVCTWIMLICFTAGQWAVYAHQHFSNATVKTHHTAQNQTTVTDKCQLCDAMHHNS